MNSTIYKGKAKVCAFYWIYVDMKTKSNCRLRLQEGIYIEKLRHEWTATKILIENEQNFSIFSEYLLIRIFASDVIAL